MQPRLSKSQMKTKLIELFQEKCRMPDRQDWYNQEADCIIWFRGGPNCYMTPEEYEELEKNSQPEATPEETWEKMSHVFLTMLLSNGMPADKAQNIVSTKLIKETSKHSGIYVAIDTTDDNLLKELFYELSLYKRRFQTAFIQHSGFFQRPLCTNNIATLIYEYADTIDPLSDALRKGTLRTYSNKPGNQYLEFKKADDFNEAVAQLKAANYREAKDDKAYDFRKAAQSNTLEIRENIYVMHGEIILTEDTKPSLSR